MTVTTERTYRARSKDDTQICSLVDAGRKYVWLCTGWSEEGGITTATYPDDGVMSAEDALRQFVQHGEGGMLMSWD